MKPRLSLRLGKGERFFNFSVDHDGDLCVSHFTRKVGEIKTVKIRGRIASGARSLFYEGMRQDSFNRRYPTSGGVG